MLLSILASQSMIIESAISLSMVKKLHDKPEGCEPMFLTRSEAGDLHA